MKIKFLKEYKFLRGFDNDVDLSTTKIVKGAIVDTVEDEVPDVDVRWLIDNGFAEEVQESGWWKPKSNESYYFLGIIGEADAIPWYNDKLDEYRYSVGNYFKTKDAAERYRDYLKAIATVRQDEGVIDLQGIGEEYEATPDNKYDEFCVYTVAFNLYPRKLVVTDSDEYISANAIWFDTVEHAQASLDKHPDGWGIIANYDWSRE